MRVQCRIGGAGKAHIDDARAVVRRPLQAFVDRKRGSLGVARFVEGARRQKLRARRDAQKLSVRGDRAGHRGAVLVRFVVAAQRVEVLHDRAVEIGIFGVDLRIDQRDQDVFPGRDVMRLLDLQFAQHVLRRVARADCGANLWRVLLQRENIIGLHAGDDAFVLDARRRGRRPDGGR